MGMPVPANEVAERAERIRTALEADGGFATRRADRARRGADHRGPRSGPRAVPRGRLVGAAGAGHRAGRSCPRTPTRTARCSRACRADAVARAGPGAGPRRRPGRLLGSRLGGAAGGRHVRRRARGRRRRADRRWTSSSAERRPRTGCAGRPATTPPARCTAATASSTTRRSRPRPSSGATGERVAILDVDYHHGNGTQQIFWRRGDVRYVSIHADPDRDYPYFLGRADETGEGDGAGENLNLPLRAGRRATRPTSPPSTGRSRRSRPCRAPSSSSRSASTPTGSTRSATFALTTDVYHEIGRRTAALGRRSSSSRRAATTGRRSARTPGPGCAAPRAAPFDPLPGGGLRSSGAVAG